MFLIDVTYNLTAAGPVWALALMDASRARLRSSPLAKMDHWHKQGQEYLRTVFPHEAENFPAAMIYIGDAAREYCDLPQGSVVQLAIRNVAYHALDGLPPTGTLKPLRRNGVRNEAIAS